MAGMPLEKLLKEGLGLKKREISRAKFRKNGIRVNGKQQRVSYITGAGDLVQVCLEEAAGELPGVTPRQGKLEILYEDEDLIVVNKPGGMPCHPGRGHYDDSLGNRLAAYYEEQGAAAKIRAVGRLDKDTWGLMLYGKNQVAAARLFRQREEGKLRKEYYALLAGIPGQDTGIIRQPIRRQPKEKQKMEVHREGKPAETWYRVLGTSKGRALVKCVLKTGRTHQIRVHMAWLGCPILGDVLYGNEENPFSDGLALYAGTMAFLQPFSGKEIVIQAFPKAWSHSLREWKLSEAAAEEISAWEQEKENQSI